jgi:pyridoxal phosphate enzyme (YggS family)
MTPASIREDLQRIQERIATSAHRAGRRSEDIILIGVSKTQTVEAIRAAYDAGLRHFGENRVQEWEGKHTHLADLQATWHDIGHLQSNKANRAARLFQSIDSVDDFALAQRLNRARQDSGQCEKLRVLLEVRMGAEESKSGVTAGNLNALAEKVLLLPRLELKGLMCIPPFTDNPEGARPFFRRMCELRDKLAKQFGQPFPVLSMGMSHDFDVAIEEGATEVRIGTAIFGARRTPE